MSIPQLVLELECRKALTKILFFRNTPSLTPLIHSRTSFHCSSTPATPVQNSKNRAKWGRVEKRPSDRIFTDFPRQFCAKWGECGPGDDHKNMHTLSGCRQFEGLGMQHVGQVRRKVTSRCISTDTNLGHARPNYEFDAFQCSFASPRCVHELHTQLELLLMLGWRPIGFSRVNVHRKCPPIKFHVDLMTGS